METQISQNAPDFKIAPSVYHKSAVKPCPAWMIVPQGKFCEVQMLKFVYFYPIGCYGNQTSENSKNIFH